MKIEVFESRKKWYWHFKASNGKITACAESFPTKNNAVRAAKAVVRSVVRPIFKSKTLLDFKISTRAGVYTIVWW